MALVITSRAFTHNGPMPIKYTCEDEDLSPPLEWSGVPDGTQSLALIADDPDAPDPAAPKRVYVHWVLYDVPPTATGLDEGASRSRLPSGAREGKNDGGATRSDMAHPDSRSRGQINEVRLKKVKGLTDLPQGPSFWWR